MQEKLEKYAREQIKKGLEQCTDGQINKFRRMYAHNQPHKDIGEIVDDMPIERLDTALDQVERTIIKNKK